MMGLFIKDFKLLALQKKFLLILVVLTAIFMTFGYDASFLVSYPVFLCTFFVITTISYDDFNHGTSFLMTLPITRKSYVQEKYALSFVVSFVTWAIATTAATIYQMFITPDFVFIEWIGICVVLLCLPLFFLIIVLPIQLKYGAEKGRIAMIIAMGIAFAIVYVGLKIFDYFDIAAVAYIESLPVVNIVLFGIVLLIMTVAVSYLLSVKIMRKKEF